MLKAMKGEIDINTNIVGVFNMSLSPMDRSSKMKINKETQYLNDTLNKMDFIDTYRTFHPKTTEYTIFSSAHGTFSRIDHILGNKSSLGKFTKIEIVIKYLFRPQCYDTRYQLQEKICKKCKQWRLNNTLVNNQEITEEIKEEIKKYLETNDNENTIPKPMGCTKSRSKREVYSNTNLPQETRNISNDLTLHLKQLEKEEQKKPKSAEGKKS